MIFINVFMDIMYIHSRIARGGTWLNVGLSKVAKSLLHWSLRHQPAVYIMIQCTEPATPAVIVFCEFPVSLQEAVLGLKTPTPITVLLESREGFFRLLQVESFPHFGKEQIKRRKTGTSNIQADEDRCKQTQTDGQA